jgi:hypothetical protein
VRFIDGIAVDYTVKVSDKDGSFFVWARSLDRALQLQTKNGTAREFALRNYALDFGALDEVGSDDDSATRVELLTPAQFHFATSLGGIDFRPEMLSAVNDNAAGGTGRISYAVNGTGPARAPIDGSQSDIKAVIDLLQRRRAAVANYKDACCAAAFTFGRMRVRSNTVWRQNTQFRAPYRHAQKKIIPTKEITFLHPRRVARPDSVGNWRIAA